MRNAIPFLAITACAALFTAGCAGPEDKMGRGITNLTEFTRMGQIQRSVEQTAIFDAPNYNYATGLIRGVNQSLERTAMGAYEIVTFPLPPYKPILTKYVPPGTVYPASYRPGLASFGTFDTDQYIGFSGGEVAPFIPGSRFTIFDN
jgi:putative exosortase-associated protein (TIGR04073 family)